MDFLDALNKKLIWAVGNDLPLELQSCLDQGADVGIADHLPLIIAVNKGNLAITQILLEHGADVHVQHETLLRGAVIHGLGLIQSRLELVQLLLKYGADLHADHDGVLFLACEQGCLPIVALLLEKGADVHAGSNQALSIAASKGFIEVVRILLDHGADVQYPNYQSIFGAMKNKHLSVVHLLLTHGEQSASRLSILLHLAISQKDTEMVQLLVMSYGASAEDGLRALKETPQPQIRVWLEEVVCRQQERQILEETVGSFTPRPSPRI